MICSLHLLVAGVVLERMKFLRRWSLRIFAGFLCLLALLWLWAQAGQRAYRHKAEQLLADVRKIYPGMPQAEAEAILAPWKAGGDFQHSCDVASDSCDVTVTLPAPLPEWLWLKGEPGALDTAKLWLAHAVVYVGLRQAYTRGGFSFQYRTVHEVWFIFGVLTPLDQWLLKGEHAVLGAATERMELSDSTLDPEGVTSNPSVRVRSLSPRDLGLTVVFSPSVSPDERARLMDFQLDCLTRLIPCRDEREILPEAARLRDEAHSGR
jgi:hypothetical protein